MGCGSNRGLVGGYPGKIGKAMERHARVGVVLGMKGHVPEEEPDRRTRRDRPGPAPNRVFNRFPITRLADLAPPMLGHQVEPKQRLTEKHRNDPEHQGQIGLKPDRSADPATVYSDLDPALPDNLDPAGLGHHRLGNLTQRSGDEAAKGPMPVSQPANKIRVLTPRPWLRTIEFRIGTRNLGETVMGEVEVHEETARQEQQKADSRGHADVQPSARECRAMHTFVQRCEQANPKAPWIAIMGQAHISQTPVSILAERMRCLKWSARGAVSLAAGCPANLFPTEVRKGLPVHHRSVSR